MSECWNWGGYIDARGYGKRNEAARRYRARLKDKPCPNCEGEGVMAWGPTCPTCLGSGVE